VDPGRQAPRFTAREGQRSMQMGLLAGHIRIAHESRLFIPCQSGGPPFCQVASPDFQDLRHDLPRAQYRWTNMPKVWTVELKRPPVTTVTKSGPTRRRATVPHGTEGPECDYCDTEGHQGQ